MRASFEIIIEISKLARGSTEPVLLLAAITQLLDAVFYLADVGYMHHDLKTENLVFDGRRLNLIDFGAVQKRDACPDMKVILPFNFEVFFG